MKKRMLIALVLVALLLPVMTGCGSKKAEAISQEQAQQIAITEIGISEDAVTDVHIHVVTENGIPCYNVHLSTTQGEYSVLIHAGTGQVLDTGSGSNH